ncbi:MAG: hypothetical protein J5586_07010 [Clostridia bacterium]|nr:hypothetical protein [Clostridia bacterium]
MKISRSLIAYMLAAVLALSACAMAGCVKKTKPGPDPAPPEYFVEPGVLPGEQSIVRYALPLISKTAQTNGCTVQYPYICSAGMDLLNINMHSVFMEIADEMEVSGGRIGYSAEFNKYGLLSFLVTYFSDDGAVLGADTANFDCDTGKRVFISDCFGPGASEAPAVLREIAARVADINGYNVISDIPEVTDASPFLFTFGGLYLVYREYELTSDPGVLRIKVRCDEVASLISDDGLLARVN